MLNKKELGSKRVKRKLLSFSAIIIGVFMVIHALYRLTYDPMCIPQSSIELAFEILAGFPLFIIGSNALAQW